MTGTVGYYAVLSLVAGIGIPIMAALNAGLGARLQNVILAAVVLFLVAGGASLIALFSTGQFHQRPAMTGIPVHYFLGGIFVAFYVLTITWVAPKFGVGNAVFFVLFGQLISAVLVDHFGLFGARIVRIDLSRSVGLVMMVAGVYLSRR